MAAPRGHLVAVGTRVEGRCELDALQRLLPHNHGLQLHFADDDGASIDKGLDAGGVLRLGGIELRPGAVAQRRLVPRNVNVVLNTNAGAVQRAVLARPEIGARGDDHPVSEARLGGIDSYEGGAWAIGGAWVMRRPGLEDGHKAAVEVVVHTPWLPRLAVQKHIRTGGHACGVRVAAVAVDKGLRLDVPLV